MLVIFSAEDAIERRVGWTAIVIVVFNVSRMLFVPDFCFMNSQRPSISLYGLMPCDYLNSMRLLAVVVC